MLLLLTRWEAEVEATLVGEAAEVTLLWELCHRMHQSLPLTVASQQASLSVPSSMYSAETVAQPARQSARYALLLLN